MKETNGMLITSRIDYALSQIGKRRVDLSKDIGLSLSVITGWKTRGTIPAADTLFKISEYLKVSVEWLLYGENNSTFGDFEVDERLKNLIAGFNALKEDDKQNIELMIEAFLKKTKIQNKVSLLG